MKKIYEFYENKKTSMLTSNLLARSTVGTVPMLCPYRIMFSGDTPIRVRRACHAASMSAYRFFSLGLPRKARVRIWVLLARWIWVLLARWIWVLLARWIWVLLARCMRSQHFFYSDPRFNRREIYYSRWMAAKEKMKIKRRFRGEKNKRGKEKLR